MDYKQKYEESQLTIAALKGELEALKKLIFGSRHERFSPDQHNPHQLPLGMEAEHVAALDVVSAQKSSYTRTTTDTELKSHPVRISCGNTSKEEMWWWNPGKYHRLKKVRRRDH